MSGVFQSGSSQLGFWRILSENNEMETPESIVAPPTQKPILFFFAIGDLNCPQYVFYNIDDFRYRSFSSRSLNFILMLPIVCWTIWSCVLVKGDSPQLSPFSAFGTES